MRTPDATTNRPEVLERLSQSVPAVATLNSEGNPGISQANRALTPFGYEIRPGSGGAFDLYHGGALVRAGFTALRPPSVSADGTDFVMAIGQVADEMWLLRPDGLHPWAYLQDMWIPPVFAGGRLVSVTSSDRRNIEVSVGGTVSFRTSVNEPVGQLPVKKLSAWNGKWVLETVHHVIVEGEPLDYQESFGWTLIGGKPFHFIRKDDAYGFVYDGTEWLPGYTEIIHNACCEGARFNPSLSETGAGFYGFRDRAWRWVTLSL